LKKKIINKQKYDILSDGKNIISLSQNSNYKWLSTLFLLQKNGKIIDVEPVDTWEGKYRSCIGNQGEHIASFVLGEYQNIEDYQQSYYKKRQLAMYDPISKHFFGDGYIIHKQCYKLVAEKIPNFNFIHMCLQKINYNEIYPYMCQNIPWMKFFLNDKGYFLENPMTNDKNKKRIINIIKTIVFYD